MANPDYAPMFSKDVGNFFRSPVREIFKKVDLNAIYSFAGGYPSAETFPLEDIRQCMSLVIDKWGGQAFQYGATQGVTVLREAVARRCGVTLTACRLRLRPSRALTCAQGCSLTRGTWCLPQILRIWEPCSPSAPIVRISVVWPMLLICRLIARLSRPQSTRLYRRERR